MGRTMVSDLERDDYDEFQFLRFHADWAGLRWEASPRVARGDADAGGGQRISFLHWAGDDPELVLLHGAGQNAHTWDTFAMALSRPLLAIDLPGHGRSDWRDDRNYWPDANAAAVATVLERRAPAAHAIGGLSLGGPTALRLATAGPD